VGFVFAVLRQQEPHILNNYAMFTCDIVISYAMWFKRLFVNNTLITFYSLLRYTYINRRYKKAQ